MAKRYISPEAKRRISEAAKRRWAEYRAAKAAGRPVKKTGRPVGRPPGSGRVGRPPAVMSMGGEFSGVAIDQLIALRRRIDQELADRLVRGQA